jgi:hypothetical protein
MYYMLVQNVYIPPHKRNVGFSPKLNPLTTNEDEDGVGYTKLPMRTTRTTTTMQHLYKMGVFQYLCKRLQNSPEQHGIK